MRGYAIGESLRQLNGIVAGMLGMSWWRFLLFNALGGALWVIAWVSAASFFTEHMSVITALAHQDRRRRTHSGLFRPSFLDLLVRRCDAPVDPCGDERGYAEIGLVLA